MPIPEKPVVLILEDDPFLALWYEDIIRYAGASVGASFPSCEAAEEWLSGREPDAAIVDVSLQDGSGAHLAKTLCGRKIPFLVVSSHPANSQSVELRFSSLANGCKSRPHLERLKQRCTLCCPKRKAPELFVRRQIILDRWRRDLVEDAAHRTIDFMRRSFGVASDDFGLWLV